MRALRPVRRHHGVSIPSTPAPFGAVEDQIQRGFAADLIVRVAEFIPLPGENLGADGAAWAAFDLLVAEAAVMLAEALSSDAELAVHSLTTAPIGADPICGLLRERTIDLLTVRHGG